MRKDSRIFVAGHNGMVGSAIVRALQARGYTNLIMSSRKDLDLRNQEATERFFDDQKPEFVFCSAAKVGGILANHHHPAEFLYDNLMIQTNVIHSAWKHGVSKFLFLGSSCIYPKYAPQPIQEDSLLTGLLEPTNEAYAVAKIAGIKMAAAYRRQYGFSAISAMPTNLYGPNDNFDLQSSHVLPALIRKFHDAQVSRAPEVVIWGTGSPRREFLHVDDLADAALFLMLEYDGDGIVNVGVGEDIEIRELAELIRRVVGYSGRLVCDPSKPDGTPRKLLNVSRLYGMGWRPGISLEDGVQTTYDWYLAHAAVGAPGRA